MAGVMMMMMGVAHERVRVPFKDEAAILQCLDHQSAALGGHEDVVGKVCGDEEDGTAINQSSRACEWESVPGSLHSGKCQWTRQLHDPSSSVKPFAIDLDDKIVIWRY